jgi:hypothetical protein
MLRRDPKHVDGLMVFRKTGGLIRRGSIGHGDKGVRRQPRDSLDIAVAFAWEPVDFV